jgi:antibiotic biosynthesis monooxygenase (ABM) superfamily enzyme
MYTEYNLSEALVKRIQRPASAQLLAQEHWTDTLWSSMWFRLPSDTRAIVPPSRWKMWLTSVLAIYLLVFAFLAWVNPHIKGWPIALRAAVFPLVLLSLMTYLVMPNITRLLRPWLISRPE